MQQNTLRVVGVVLILVGGGLGVWGISWYQSGSDCASYYLSVEEGSSGYTDAPMVAYENLTAEQQRVVRQTLATEDNYKGFSQSFFDQPTRVEYEGRTYRVITAVSDGCQPLLNFLLRVLPLVAGGGLLLGGMYLIYERR